MSHDFYMISTTTATVLHCYVRTACPPFLRSTYTQLRLSIRYVRTRINSTGLFIANLFAAVRFFLSAACICMTHDLCISTLTHSASSHHDIFRVLTIYIFLPSSFLPSPPELIHAPPPPYQKVENAQLEHEIQESGIRLPQESWVDEGQETVPEEPLPEYLAALWDFAEGKTHCPKPASPGTSVTDAMASPPATPTAAPTGMRYSRQTSSSSCTSSLSSASTEAPSSAHSSPVTTRPPPSVVNPGQALEDASTLCAFMEAAQTRSAKRPRVRVAPQEYPAGGAAGGASGTAQQHQQHQLQRQQQQHPRVWSDHGSTTSESRGSSESDEDAANERRSRSSASKHADGECAAGGGGVSGGDGGAMLSPAFWTSREVLERYVLPRQQLLRG